MLYDEYFTGSNVWILSSLRDDLDGIDFITVDPKVPEDQRAIDEQIASRHESSESNLETNQVVTTVVDVSGFACVSFSMVLLIALVLFISRR